MTKQTINVGTSPNDNRGDSLRASFQKINANFTELYTALGINADVNLNLGAFEFAGSVLSTTDSSAIVIDQAVTVSSNLTVGGDVLPSVANGGDLGSSARPWKSLYISNNTIYIGGTAVGLDANGNLTTGGTVVGSTPAWANITGKPSFATVATTGAYADLTGKPTIPTLVSQLSNDSGFLTSVSNIQSESDVSIQVNLSDSTLRRWSFGEDGILTLPSVGKISNGAYDWTFGTDGGLTFPGTPRIATDSDNFEVQAAESINFEANAVVSIYTDTSGNAYQWIFGTDGSLQIPGDIRSEGNINIDINLSDSTLRRWSFGEDGNLTLPQGGNISEGGGISGAIKLTPAGGANEYQALLIYPTAGEGDHIHLTAGGGTTELYLGDDLHYVKLASDGNIRIQADNGVNGAAWTFGTDGSLQIPGDIRSEGNINIEINLSDSTLRRWSFGEDGVLTLPGILKIDDGVHEKFQTKADATGIVTHDCSLGHIFYHTSPDALFTVNFTNLNLSSGYATALTLIIEQGGTGFIPNSVGIGGVIQTLNWQGNVTPTPSTNRTDVVRFSIINVSGTYTVLGQLTGF